MADVRGGSDFLLFLFAASFAITCLVFPSVNLNSQIFPSRAVEKIILALVVLAITYGFLGIFHVGDGGRWLSSYGSSDTQKSSLSNPIPLSEGHDSDHGRVYEPVTPPAGKPAAPKKRKAHKPKDGNDNSPAAQPPPQPLPPPSFSPLEEKIKKKRVGLDSKGSSGSLKTKKKNRGQEIENSKPLRVSQRQDKGRRRNLDAVPGSSSKTVHSGKTRNIDRNKEEQQFQSKQIIADDNCDRKAAVQPVTTLTGKRAVPTERKAKGTRQTNASDEETKKKRGSTKESSGSLKTKKKNRGRKRIKSSESLPVSQSLPSSSHQPLPGIDTPFAHKEGKKMADLAAPLPPAAPRKKKSHASLTATPNSESSDDSLNSGGLSLMPPRPPSVGPAKWKLRMVKHPVWIISPIASRNKSPEATSPASCLGPYSDSKAEMFISTIKAQQTLEEMGIQEAEKV